MYCAAQIGGHTFKRNAPFATKNGGGLIFEGGSIFITVATYYFTHAKKFSEKYYVYYTYKLKGLNQMSGHI